MGMEVPGDACCLVSLPEMPAEESGLVRVTSEEDIINKNAGRWID